MLEQLVGLYPPIQRVRHDVSQYGLGEAARLHLARCGINLQINIPDNSQEALNSKAVLEVCPHTGFHTGVIEGFATLPNRKKDITIIGDGAMFNLWLGEETGINLIDIQGVARQPAVTLWSKGLRQLRLLTTDRQAPNLREQVRINSQNNADAITHIRLGNLVYYAPDGGCDPKLPWPRRTGEIINGINPEIEAFVIMVHIKNLSEWDTLTFLPLKNRARKMAKKDAVYVSQPLPIADLQYQVQLCETRREKDRTLTKMLQAAHNNWKLNPTKPFPLLHH